jgi:hypothetical protein
MPAAKPTKAQQAVIVQMTKGSPLYNLLATGMTWDDSHEFGGTLQGQTISIPTIKAMRERGLIKEARRYRVTDDLWHIDYELAN